MTARELARLIDQTDLRPEATAADIDRLCDQACEWGFYAVCVNPVFVARAARRLGGAGPVVVSVAGFPLGAVLTDIKAEEARRAVGEGAREIDMVLRIGDLRAGDTRAVRDDIAAVVDAVRAVLPEGVIKVIFETAVLAREQIVAGCRCCAEAQADFVKTSTGFHPAGGATVEAVRLLHRFATPMKVKAAAGIRDFKTAKAMIDAGAARIGTSAGVAIMKDLLARQGE